MENISPSLTIEAKVMRSLSGHYYGSAILHGCVLIRMYEKSNVVNNQRYDFYFTGHAEVPPYTILTYWTATGVFAEVEWPDFWILQAIPGAPSISIGEHSQWHFGIKGPLETLAHAEGEECVDRLKDWWNNWAPAHGGQNELIARWLAENLNQRSLGPYPDYISNLDPTHPPYIPVESWKFNLPE